MLMAIEIKLSVMMAERNVRLKDLSEAVGITLANLSNLKNSKAKSIRLSTLDAICNYLDCDAGDIIKHRPTETPLFHPTEISLPKDFLD